jgi:methyl-accepting chemotaxis protein
MQGQPRLDPEVALMKLRLLMAVILGPLLALGGTLAYFDLRDLNFMLEDARRASIASVEIDQVADLIHELQKERGYSAGYTASNGINFADRLTAQRRETDAVLANTAESLEELSAAHPETMARLRTGLSELRAWRSRIDAGEVTVPELAGYYTGVVNTALELQSEVVNTMAASELERITRAALYVTRAKEAAGLERAMGATGLGAAEFPHDVFNRFIELGAVQLTTLNRAQDEIGDPDFTRVILSHPSHAAIEEQREIIRGAMTGLRQPILTAGSWFETSTAWIDYLRDVESGLKTTAIASAAEIYADLRAKRTRIIAASGIAIVFAISLAVAGFERVIYRVKRLTKAMYRFTEGEFDVWIPGINDRDEVGEMAAAVYAFKQETLAMRKAAAEQKVDDEAIILGKAQRVVDLLTEGLAALAQADLTRHFDERLDAEYDSIRIDFNTATARLREVTEAIVTTAVDLDARAGELLRSSAALGERTVEQVNTIDATNARVGQLSQEVEAYAGNVSDAARLAASAKDTADRSGEVVRSAVDAMSRISASSQEIGRIISMIDDIAFQTNLLALNAGVEAARAGEAGRGFAVVAQEVRELARRSSEATQEIKSLIDDSRRQVQDGVELVGEAGDALQAIFGEIVQVDGTLGSVADGAVRQADSLRTLAEDIARLNALAARNTEMAEESGRAAGETTAISRRLTELVGDFRIAPDAGRQAAAQKAAGGAG